MSSQEEDTLKSINLKTLLTLLTLFMILATSAGSWFVQAHRVNALEELVAKHELILDVPRYTLADDQRRMDQFTNAITKEMDRRGTWMDGHDAYRLETIKSQAETGADIREIKTLVIQMRDDFENLKIEKGKSQ